VGAEVIEVSSIHIASRVAIMEDGQQLPVTNAFDEHGDDCDLEEAVVCVAGPDKDGMWVTIDFRDMEKVRLC
jgi:hypothetical protein